MKSLEQIITDEEASLSHRLLSNPVTKDAGKYEFMTIPYRNLADVKRAERLQHKGWEVISIVSEQLLLQRLAYKG